MVVAERSGDQLAALLLGGMQRAWPDLQADGVGGPQMQALGFQSRWSCDELSVRGLVEALMRYRRITGIRRFVFIAAEKEPPFGIACYELDQQAIDLGNEIIDAQLATFRECQALNSWPCYSSSTETLSLPTWALKNNENQ